MKLGIITYNHRHLKTEQLVAKYSSNRSIKEIHLFAIPFLSRKSRNVIFNHRPVMTSGVLTKDLGRINGVFFHSWDGLYPLADICDFFVIGGAGILDISFAKGKPIVNGHPGIIPLTRGLDSFKWAIFNGDPIGITIHLIDSEVDKGEILKIAKTPVFPSDTLTSLARRHYELELDLLTNVIDYLDRREEVKFEEKPPTRRMDSEREKKLILKFDKWKERYV